VIIQLGNDILRNLGVQEPIEDLAVFFSDEFYIQFFQAAFPDIDFSQLTAGQDEQEMAENIQALIDLLGEQILKYDLSHIRGDEIVNGNPEHCINLLQLVQEIAQMINNKQGGAAQSQQQQPQSNQPSQQQQYMVDNDEDDMVDPEDVQLKEALDFEGEDISKDMLQQQVMAVAPAGEDDDELEQQLMQALQNQPEIQKKQHHSEDDDMMG